MKIESKEQAVVNLRMNLREFEAEKLHCNAQACRDVIAWLESTPAATSWVESADTGNPVPRVCLWSDNKAMSFATSEPDRAAWEGIRETHHIPLPPLPEKAKPKTIGERVANRVFDVNMVMMTVNRATLAKLIDDVIAEDREGRK